MTDVPPVAGSDGNSGDATIDNEIKLMNDEFAQATRAQIAITVNKVKGDSELDASKQRPQ
jgi:hypothetical protein